MRRTLKTLQVLSWLFIFTAALPLSVQAATLEWSALAGRERIIINKEPSEGLPGNVARIGKKSILIPFTEVPLGLFKEALEEAEIFHKTEGMGRALVIHTKTDEFGFVVSKQTPTQLVIDFFPDKLGARWKAATLPPTTDIPPGYALKEYPNAEKLPPEIQSLPAAWNQKRENPKTENSENESALRSIAQSPVQSSSQEEGERPESIGTRKQSATREQPVPKPDHEAEDIQPSSAKIESAGQSSQPGQPIREGQPIKEDQANQLNLPSQPDQTGQPSQTDPSLFAKDDKSFQQASNSASELVQTASLDPAASRDSSSFAALPSGESTAVKTGLSKSNKDSKSRPDLLPGIGQQLGPVTYRGSFNPGSLEDIVEPSPAGKMQIEAQESTGQAVDLTASEREISAEDISTSKEDGSIRHSAQLEAEDLSDTKLPKDSTSSPSAEKEAKQKEDKSPSAEGLDDEKVIYVNELGEEVEAPIDPVKRLEEIGEHLIKQELALALEKTEQVLEHSKLSLDQREEALHIKAELLFTIHKDDLEHMAQTIIDSNNQAINVNMRSPRNAAALLRLGYVHLKSNNIPEARARFSQLHRMYPNDENVPLSYYYWGDYYYNKGDLQKAVDEFQMVLQKFPNSKYARETALGLARSFYQLGYYEQAYAIVEYIEQRWPRFYLAYTPFLNMMGDVAFRLNDLDNAARHYWLYANLDPEAKDTDLILTRIGDIYAVQQQMDAAKEVYSEVVKRFPGKDGALISLMRLAEESINDDPNIAAMFDSFSGTPAMDPVEVYELIINEHPDNGLVPLAQLKLAMWYLWKHDYIKSLDVAANFMERFPNDELTPKLKELALKTFAILAAESVADGSYSRMRNVWENYPLLQGQEEMLTPESRVALGVSYWKDGRPDDALVAVEPFFLGNKIPEYSEMALGLVLSIYLDYEQWPAIEEVGRRVQLWEISEENQMQLDYAMALAKENQGKVDDAAFLWEKLYESKKLPDEQMLFAVYFLARDAERRHKADEAYLLGIEALKRLRVGAEKNPDQEDSGKIKSQLSSLMALTEEGGRLGESLDYADQYLKYLPETDPDRAAVYFRMGRIFKKQGNEAGWRQEMEKISKGYPETVYGQTAAAALSSSNLAKEAARFAPTGQ